jgi:hypothetical protein
MKLDELRPLGGRLLCTLYRRPQEAVTESGLILNPAWLRDNNRQFWRLRMWSEDGAAHLRDMGAEPEEGMLLMTAPNQGVRVEGVEQDEEHFWVWAEQVIAVLEEEP